METGKTDSNEGAVTACHFLSLPPELIARTAGFLSTRDVLKLAQTCKWLHGICYDPLVFQKLIRKQANAAKRRKKFYPTGNSSSLDEVLRPYMRRYQENTPQLPVTQIWARFSATTDMLTNLRERILYLVYYSADEEVQLTEAQKRDLEGLVGIIAAVIVLGYPFVFPLEEPVRAYPPRKVYRFNLAHIKAFVRHNLTPGLVGYPPAERMETFYLQMAFVTVVATLHPAHNPGLCSESVDQLRMMAGQFEQARKFEEGQDSPLPFDANDHSIKLQAMAALASLMRKADITYHPSLEKLGFLKGEPGEFGKAVGEDDERREDVAPLLPMPDFGDSTARRIPQDDTDDIADREAEDPLQPPRSSALREQAPPLCWPTWTDWYQRRMLQLGIAIGGPDDGEWFGQYSYGLGAHFEGPMEAIRFTRIDRPTDWQDDDSDDDSEDDFEDDNAPDQGQQGASSCRFIQATDATDDIGPFEFTGEVNIRSGDVKLKKRYLGQNDHSWDYVGVMTPFGICGRWGRIRRRGQTGGYFWLWKKEWMTNEATSWDQAHEDIAEVDMVGSGSMG